MATRQRITSYAKRRAARRLGRTLPFVGVLVGAATIFSAMRRKGVISGAVDTGLNMVPFVGTAKTAVEIARGKDFFPDRYGRTAVAATRR